MRRPISPIRKAILNRSSETYLFIILLSFAASVSITRLFLELTGYPQIGGGELHIAHVLWGGLLLFIAILLLLIYANRWIFPVAAMISGIGVGLFIDEVGKFITQDNDYFYPSAAPIIYVLFLLTVLVFLLVRKPRERDIRTELYYVLDDLKEVADRDLSESEKRSIETRLDEILARQPDPDLESLAKAIQKFIQQKHLYLAPHRPTILERLKNRWLRFEKTLLNRTRLRRLLIISLISWGGFLLIAPTAILLLSNSQAQLESILTSISNNEYIRNLTGLNWFEARIVLESTIGFLLCGSAMIWLFKQERWALIISTLVLLLSLTVVNLLVFYFDQFSSIITSLIQFLILMGIYRYRILYANSTVPPS